ncbi:autotransporter outer membrane beta-barrel domain-containing protein [Campylobacter mucosalis]|uniref:Putative autotransporter beta-domain protein n=1 Tax=Campylobacter mucosalis CCUG 21559 TaxID=1032067 RepID=A0A6G5QI73_9BACT|nr:autotransporter outer membrane beta-barrel domain-containing protein [Campylobacter mucosalis]QCD45309.1 putative autotransporter beta-domain protein [Campylobacter mucosalis CCUG 21559]
MKFSKIACVALLSASISTVALADNDQLTGLLSAKNYQATKEAAYQNIMKAIKDLQNIKYANLKNWNGDAAGDGKNGLSAELNTKIYNALKTIKDNKENIKGLEKLEVASGTSKLTIETNGDIKLIITEDSGKHTAVNNGGSDAITLTLEDFKSGSGQNNDKIEKMFADNNKDVWDKFIEEFIKEHNRLKASRDSEINTEALNLVKAAGGVVDPDDQYSAFIENKSTIDNAIKADIAAKEKAVTDAQGKVDEAVKKVVADNLNLLRKDNAGIIKQAEAINALAKQLDDAKLLESKQENNIQKATALKAAIDAGVKLKRKNAEATLLTKDDIDAILAGGAGKVKVVAGDFDGNANDLTGDANIGTVLNALIGEVGVSGALQAKEIAKTEIEKITQEIEKVDTANGELKKSNKLMTDTDKTIATITSSEEIAFFKSTALDNAIQNKQSNQIKTAQQELKNAANARATGVTKVANLEEKQGEVLGSFTDTVLANDTVKSIVTTYDAKELADTAKALNTSIEQSQRSQNKGTSTDIIMFNTGLATNTRLAKLSNPFNADLALAQAINELEGETFADAGDSLSSVIKEYTNRFNHDNNLWGNIFGGKGKIKDSANPSIWGVTLGYDKAFDNTIVGGFINYAKVQSKDSQVRSESDNYSFGVYSRSYFDQSEIDAKIGYGFGRNELSRHAMDSKIGTSTGKYDSKFFDVDVEYGYVFGLGNAMFIKPIAGLSYTHIKHDGFTEDGNVPAIFGNTNLKTLKAKLGSEFRVYTDNASYFYITPGVERELSKSTNDLSVKFVGSSKDVVFDADKKKNTYITLKTGAEFKITNNLSTNINFGAKAKAKEQYYNGTLGVSYKF